MAQPGPGAPAGSRPVDLGRPQLVDGFANGWHVSAADLQTLGGADFKVALTWTPQRVVWAALAVSGATLLLCLVLGFLPTRWRRAIRGRLPRRLRGPAGPDAPARAAAPFDSPALTLPSFRDTSGVGEPYRWRLRIPRALLVGAATGGVAALVTPLTAALVVAGLVAIGLILPWLRALATIAAVAAIVAGCLNVVRGQAVHHFLPGSNWDGSFLNADNLILLGLVLLLADAAISAFGLRVPKPLRRRALRARKAEPAAPPEAVPQT